jgi:hypothetical protein
MYIVLSDETERRLRLAVVTVFGGKKGDLSNAIEEAVKQWLSKKSSRRSVASWVKQEQARDKKKRHEKKR